jgi:hypothetical protein
MLIKVIIPSGLSEVKDSPAAFAALDAGGISDII